jgi:predicted dehydrogenase
MTKNTPNTTTTKTFLTAPPFQTFAKPPRILIIGAGSRGTSYAHFIRTCSNASIVSICEPDSHKNCAFGSKYIWGASNVPAFGQSFTSWEEWVSYEKERRESAKTGKGLTGASGFKPVIVGAVFVCVLDELHEKVVRGIVEGLGGGISICVEKPLSVSLTSCISMYNALENAKRDGDGEEEKKESVFGICHVLRYSPHNMLLRQLVLEDEVVGEVMSVEHVEPVGWWHFSHSYVRSVRLGCF